MDICKHSVQRVPSAAENDSAQMSPAPQPSSSARREAQVANQGGRHASAESPSPRVAGGESRMVEASLRAGDETPSGG